jgi:hydrogenase expression/formation protein HypC
MCLAIPGQIVEFMPGQPHLALVEVIGVRRRVDLGLLLDDPPRPGDWVLIHVGFAMSKISEDEASQQFKTLALLGEDTAAMEEVRGYEQ